LSEKSCQKNNKAEPQVFTVYRSNTNVQKTSLYKQLTITVQTAHLYTDL